MTYRIVLGDPEKPQTGAVSRDTLNEALHWLGDNWPASVDDMSASVYWEIPLGGFLRILGIGREGVVDMENVRIGLGLFDDHLFAATSPKAEG